jgi:hypothetical protein
LATQGWVLRQRRGTFQWLAAALAVGLAAPAAARTNGIVGYSGKSDGLYCSNAGLGCHATAAGTQAPLVHFEGPTQVDPGSQNTYRFVVTSQNPQVQIQAGLDVAASGGTLGVIAGQQERMASGEITHTGPKDNDTNAMAAWEFTWTAPNTVGEYVLFGAGNSVDASTTPDGDEAAITTLMIAVGNVVPTPTPTATPVPSTCAGDCNSDGQVTVNELIASVNVALGSLPGSTCLACDTNRDGMVSVNELVAAVGKALNGC